MAAVNRNELPLPHSRRAWLLLGAAICFCLLLGSACYRLFLAAYLDHDRQLSAQRLDAFALSLEATLSRHESLPGLLSLDPTLANLLRNPDDPARIAAANAYLETVQQGAALASAYLIATNGTTLAASNWRLPRSFVGQNYAFRPYFRDALERGLGRFYGVGVTTGEPGWFLAGPVRDNGAPLGVVVVKVSLDAMEQAMAGAGETLLLADQDGVVFLSSDRSLRYRVLAPLSPPVAKRLADPRQYGDHPLAPLAETPLPLQSSEPVRLTLPGQSVRSTHRGSRRRHSSPPWRRLPAGSGIPFPPSSAAARRAAPRL